MVLNTKDLVLNILNSKDVYTWLVHRARTAALSLPHLAAACHLPNPRGRLRLLPSMTPSPTFPTLRRWIGWQGFYTTQFSRL